MEQKKRRRELEQIWSKPATGAKGSDLHPRSPRPTKTMNSNGAKSRITPPARDGIGKHYTTLGIPFVRAYLDPALD